MTDTSDRITCSCTACAGKGWLPLQATELPVAGWMKTLCRECGGSGVAQPPQPGLGLLRAAS